MFNKILANILLQMG